VLLQLQLCPSVSCLPAHVLTSNLLEHKSRASLCRPSAQGGASEILTFLSTNLGLTMPETVALMGGHTVGRAAVSESGYGGVWKGRADTFSTGYYLSLLSVGWRRADSTSRITGKSINQWNGPPNSGTMMLNSDMEVSGGSLLCSLSLWTCRQLTLHTLP